MEKKDLRFEIQKEILVLGIEKNRRKELNIVSWNNSEAKFDIRNWAIDRKYVSRGVTLTDDELLTLLENKEELLKIIEKRKKIQALKNDI